MIRISSQVSSNGIDERVWKIR